MTIETCCNAALFVIISLSTTAIFIVGYYLGRRDEEKQWLAMDEWNKMMRNKDVPKK